MAIERAKRRGYRLLKRGSRFLRTDLFYLTKGGFWLGLNQTITVLSGLALSVGFAHLLPPDVYGNYRFVLAIAGIVTAFSLSGMGTAIVRATAQGKKSVLTSGFKTHLKWSIGMALAALVGALYYFINDNNTIALSLLIVGAFSPFLESARLYSAYLIGKKEFRRNTILGIFRRLVPIGVLLLTIALTDNVVLIILAYFSSNTITMLSLYITSRRLFERDDDEPITAEITSDSKHLSLMNFINKIAGQLDKILVFHFIGAAPLAMYVFATMPVSQLRTSLQVMKTMLLPKLAMRQVPELKRAMPQKILISFLVVIPITVVYMLIAPYIYSFLFPQYMDAVVYSRVYALLLLFVPATALFTQTFVAHMKKQELYTTRLFGPISRAGLLLVLTPMYGVWGVISALLISKLLVVILMTFFFVRLR